jgi:hypothetical protein
VSGLAVSTSAACRHHQANGGGSNGCKHSGKRNGNGVTFRETPFRELALLVIR